MLEKVQQEYLKGLYTALSKDCAVAIPGLREQDLERDVNRLLSCVERRGFRVLTQDLPDIGKHFDLCLSTGLLSRFSGTLSGTVNRESPIPRLFQGLVKRVFDDRGVLRPTPCIQSVRFLRQFYYLAKKWRMECNDSYTFNEVREFYRVDQQLRHPSLDWDGDDLFSGNGSAHNISFVDRFIPERARTQGDLFTEIDPCGSAVDTGLLLGLLQRACDTMSSALGEFRAIDWCPQHGPGVVSDLEREASKYDFPNWPERLDRVFPLSEFGYANTGIWADEAAHERWRSRYLDRLYPSRLIAVPKTQKGPRLIAAEPTANLWCQQAIRKYLVAGTESSWLRRMISFDDQTPNQRLALAASLDGRRSTIDLKAASDRMSCWVVERAFRGRRDLLLALHASRTTAIRNFIDVKSPDYYVLRKFSTMGSAVTFPVQSLIFAAICLASLAYVRGAKSTRAIQGLAKEVRVFGDDLIIPSDALGTARHLLRYLGFEVNLTKTFGIGNFRESCGVDAFMGVDVTPVYALGVPTKSKPESVVSYVAQSHNFATRGLWNVTEYYQWSATSDGLARDLPYVTAGSDILGWPSITGDDYSHLKTRWNTSLQRREYLTRTLKVRAKHMVDRGHSRLLQYFVEAPSPLMKWTGGYDVRAVVLSRPRWIPAGYRTTLIR